MPYDLFISYAHQGDNTSREAVAALVARLHAELKDDFRRRFNRDLEIFFDKEDIRDFDHWQVRCHRALRDSRFFIACLSRTYLRSKACRWEWEEWCRHELEHGLVGQSAASLWFVKLEDLDAPEDAALLRHWKGDLRQRFHVQCHEWQFGDGGAFLDVAARAELQQLTEHVAQRLRLLTLDRARRGNLPWPNVNFVGREPEQASLRAALLDAHEPSPTGIHGVGGMGKTALAQAFTYKEADAFPGGCWLFHCEGRDRLLTVFRTLVNELEIELTDEEKLDDIKAVRRVFDVLRARGPALFLLDNVDRPALLAREQMKLLADQPWARVLYTTRLAPDEFTKAGAMIRPLDLDRLPENQAVDLIRRYQPEQAFASPEHEAAACEIVRELSGFTLAVETAAVYLGQCDPRVAEPQHAVDAPNYLNKLREDLKTGGSEGVMSQLREVTATLRSTLARLDAPAKAVLQIASLLAPDGVALPWLREIAGQRHPELATDAATGENDPWTKLIRGLIGMRLFQPTPEPRVVAIHRILQRVLEAELSEGCESSKKQILAHIEVRCKAVATGWLDWINRWEIEPLQAFAHQLLAQEDSHALGVANEVAVPLSRLSRYVEAEMLYRQVLATEQKTHRLSVATLVNLSTLLQETSRFDEAEELLRQALPIAERNGPKHPTVARVLNNYGQFLRDTDRLADAESLLRYALAIDEENLGSEHPTVAIDLNNLAGVLSACNREIEAEALYRRALAIDEQSFGPEHPNVALRLNNLASVLEAASRFGDAEPLYRRALKIQEHIFGAQHPEFAVSLSNLARLLQTTNRFSAAETLYQQALAIAERGVGPDHPDVALCLNNLASLLQAANRPQEAEPSYRRALRILEKSLGARHSKVANVLNNLATLLRTTNRADEAQILLKRAIAIWEHSLGTNQPELAHGLNNLTQFMQDSGDLTGAELLLRRALTIRERHLGSKHVLVAVSLNNLACLMEEAKKLKEAESFYTKAVEIFELARTSTGLEHPDYHVVQANLLRLRRRLARTTG
jgi:tetratricopeptide (TPR) repeat protein